MTKKKKSPTPSSAPPPKAVDDLEAVGEVLDQLDGAAVQTAHVGPRAHQVERDLIGKKVADAVDYELSKLPAGAIARDPVAAWEAELHAVALVLRDEITTDEVKLSRGELPPSAQHLLAGARALLDTYDALRAQEGRG
jgi:hypothetical protein